MTQSIVQIVPALPPSIGGVGDYALQLACQLRQHSDWEIRFLVGNATWSGPSTIAGFPVHRLEVATADRLCEQLHRDRAQTVLLQYSGYGYAKRGCPQWLISGLRRWLQQGQTRRLVTMFHEIYAAGPPWSSAFWLSRKQRSLSEQLVKLSADCLASRADYARQLQVWQSPQQPPAIALPVFSNVGEPADLAPLASRPRQLAIFGASSTRLRIYQQALPPLQQICQQLQIEQIVDIGPPIEGTLPTIGETPVAIAGALPAAEVSQLLAKSVVGMVHYPTNFLAKSGVFAAYCAHGLLPIVVTDRSLKATDGLMPVTHYWPVELARRDLKLHRKTDRNQPLTLDQAQTIAQQARAWYQLHCLAQQAEIFTRYL